MLGPRGIIVNYSHHYSVAVGAPARVIKQYNFGLKQWVKLDG